jgi:hypothetical protein
MISRVLSMLAVGPLSYIRVGISLVRCKAVSGSASGNYSIPIAESAHGMYPN